MTPSQLRKSMVYGTPLFPLTELREATGAVLTSLRGLPEKTQTGALS